MEDRLGEAEQRFLKLRKTADRSFDLIRAAFIGGLVLASIGVLLLFKGSTRWGYGLLIYAGMAPVLGIFLVWRHRWASRRLSASALALADVKDLMREAPTAQAEARLDALMKDLEGTGRILEYGELQSEEGVARVRKMFRGGAQ